MFSGEKRESQEEENDQERGSIYIECGRTSLGHFRVFNQSIFSRIVGGQQAVPHSHPWQVLLSDRGRFCGGKWSLDPPHLQ